MCVRVCVCVCVCVCVTIVAKFPILTVCKARNGYKTLREISEAKLLSLGIQPGAVSHTKRNWCVVHNFRGKGMHTAVLIDAGRMALSKQASRGKISKRLALVRYE